MGRDLIGLDDKEMRRLCGADIAMVFQDPISSLNPVMTIGKQITESLKHPPQDAQGRGQDHGRHAAPLGQHPGGRAPLRRVPAPAVGRHAPARDDRPRPGVRPAPAVRRRADDRARRDRAGRDPQPPAGPADRPLHGDGARHPRPRRRRRAHRRDRRDVRRPHRRAGADVGPLLAHAPPLHRGAAALDPEGRGPQPHPPPGDHRSSARPHRPAAGLQVRAALPVRAGALPRRGAASSSSPARAAIASRATSRSAPRRTPPAWRRTSPPGCRRPSPCSMPRATATIDLSALLAADTANEAVDWSGGEGDTTDDDLSSRAGGARDE